MSEENLSLRGKLLYSFSLKTPRRLGTIIGIGWIIIETFFLYGTFYNPKATELGTTSIELNFIFKCIFLFFGIILPIFGCLIMMSSYYLPDFKIYENEFIFPFSSFREMIKNKELFISFENVKNIEMTTIPISVKCLIITTKDGKFDIRKKTVSNIEEIYDKLKTIFEQYKEKHQFISIKKFPQPSS